jgi:LysR family transcriptional regulator, benzoate and cis,cis-muconate-responsive activator of ben and cat genes
MDVQDLKFFVAVYEKKGFSRASKSLGTVQSNVSTRIRCLESSLGVRLFERRYRLVIPTENGEKLYGYAKQVIATIDTTVRELKPRVSGLV